MAVEAQLLVGAQVEQPAGGVVGACGEGAAVGEKLGGSAAVGVSGVRGSARGVMLRIPDWDHTHTDGVDVRLVTRERLPAHAVPDVPQFDRGVAGPRHKGALVGRQRQAHDVAGVAGEHRGLLARLDVPQRTGTKTEDGSAQRTSTSEAGLDLGGSPRGVS